MPFLLVFAFGLFAVRYPDACVHLVVAFVALRYYGGKWAAHRAARRFRGLWHW
jgi:hypothetical protein